MPSFSLVYTGVIVPVSVAIPVSIALLRFRYTSNALRSILYYLIMAGITSCIAAVFAFRHKNNLPLLHVYTVLELLFLLRFYRQVIPGAGVRRWTVILAWVFPVFALANLWFFQSMYRFNSYTRSLEAIIVVALGIVYMSRRTEEGSPGAGNLEQASLGGGSTGRGGVQPETWVVIGLLIYFASAFFQFTFPNIVSSTASLSTRLLIWDIHASLVLVMYLLIAAGFAKCKS